MKQLVGIQQRSDPALVRRSPRLAPREDGPDSPASEIVSLTRTLQAR